MSGVAGVFYDEWDDFARLNALWSGAILLAASAVAGIVNHFIAGYLADASRYFAPRPPDIDRRNAIRDAGVNLLRNLHKSGDYDRVILACHSLGSVIGYDILRLYWDEARKPDPSNATPQPLLAGFDASAKELLRAEPTLAELQKFQELQTQLGKELGRAGVNWLITDFVTFGSPLTHADSLWARSDLEFARKLDEREFPACPPRCDADRRDQTQIRSAFLNADRRWEPHAAAVFGPTRWTNLYFPMTWWPGGDLVGGPLAPLFGPGVRDIPVKLSYSNRRAWWMRKIPVLSHIKYWSRQRKYTPPADLPGERKDALRALRNFLRL
ncbi:hypothetical protein [Microbacterium lacus]|uniref:hypothetical protein n=1 Tax=Microbacterium lacus TaxID=415217 RepID=UPI0031D0C9BF